MSEAQLTAIDHLAFRGGEGIPGLCASFEILDEDGQSIGNALITYEGGVQQISAAENARTPEGVGVGSTFADVQAAYPELTPSGCPSAEESSEFRAPVPSNAEHAYWINFGRAPVGPDDLVAGIVLELQDQQCTG